MEKTTTQPSLPSSSPKHYSSSNPTTQTSCSLLLLTIIIISTPLPSTLSPRLSRATRSLRPTPDLSATLPKKAHSKSGIWQRMVADLLLAPHNLLPGDAAQPRSGRAISILSHTIQATTDMLMARGHILNDGEMGM